VSAAPEAASHKPSPGRGAAEAPAPLGESVELQTPTPSSGKRILPTPHGMAEPHHDSKLNRRVTPTASSEEKWRSPKRKHDRNWRDQRSLLIWGIPLESNTNTILKEIVDATTPDKRESTRERMSYAKAMYRNWKNSLQLRLVFPTIAARDKVHEALSKRKLRCGGHITKSLPYLQRVRRRTSRPSANVCPKSSETSPLGKHNNPYDALTQHPSHTPCVMETSDSEQDSEDLDPSGTPSRARAPERNPRKEKQPLRIATLNVAGLTHGKVMELANMEDGPDIIAIQEHHQKKARRFFNERYTFILGQPAHGRNSKLCHGEGFLVRHELAPRCQLLKASQNQAWLRVHGDPGKRDVILGNLYLPQVTAQTEVSKAIDRVTACMRRFSDNAIVIPLGDLNARFGNARTKQEERYIGRHGGNATRCASGAKWLQWLKDNGCCCLSGRQHPGAMVWTRIEGEHKSAIDHILMPKEHRHLIIDKSHVVNRDFDTDHHMVRFTMNSNVKRTRAKPKSREKFDVYKLMKEATTFQELLRTSFKDWNPKQLMELDDSLTIDDLYKQLEDKTIADVKATVGEKKRRSKKRCVRWFNKVRNDIDERRKIYQEFLAQDTPEGQEEAWKNYLEKRKQTREKVKRAQREDFDERMLDAAAHFKDNRKKFWSLVAQLSSKSKGRPTVLRNKRNGNICSDAKSKAEAWADYFEDLFGEDFICPNKLLDSKIRRQNEERRRTRTSGTLDQPFTSDDIRRAYAKLKRGKAKGPDEFEVEMLLAGGEPLRAAILSFINTLWEREAYPAEWSKGISFTLYKKGEPLDQDNYRGITLLSVVGKIFTRLLNARLTEHAETHNLISQDQIGYRPHRTCSDHLFTMDQVLKDRRSRGKKTYLFFVDLRKAFDTVWHDGLLECLARRGIHGKMWRMIDKIYSNSTIQCVVDQEKSRPIPCKRGVRQGCPLSPILFNIFMGELSSQTWMMKGVNFKGDNLNHLFYADDAVFFADNAAQLQKIIDTVNKVCLDWGLSINAKKSAVMIAERPKGKSAASLDDGDAEESKREPKFHLHAVHEGDEDREITTVDDYEYLGVFIDKHGTWNKQFEALAKTMTKKAKNFSFLFRHRHVPVEAKLNVFNACVRSTIEHGAEVWTLNSKQARILQSKHHQCLKDMVRCNKKTSDWAVRSQLGAIRLQTRRKLLKARWFVNVMAREEGDRRRVAMELHDKGHKPKFKRLPARLNIDPDLWNKWIDNRKLEMDQLDTEAKMPFDRIALSELTEESPRAEVTKIWHEWKGPHTPCPATPAALSQMNHDYVHEPITWKGELEKMIMNAEEQDAIEALNDPDQPKLEILKHIHAIRGKAIEQRMWGGLTLARRTCFKLASGTHALACDQHHRRGGFICRFCEAGVEESVHHHLLDCTAFTTEREEMLEDSGCNDLEDLIPEFANIEDPIRRAATILSMSMEKRNPVSKALHSFDEDDSFGPTDGRTRLQRWNEAKANGLNPPSKVGDILRKRDRHTRLLNFITSITRKRCRLREAEEFIAGLALSARHPRRRPNAKRRRAPPSNRPAKRRRTQPRESKESEASSSNPAGRPRSRPTKRSRAGPRDRPAKRRRTRQDSIRNTHTEHVPHVSANHHVSMKQATLLSFYSRKSPTGQTEAALSSTVPPLSGRSQ